MIRARYACLALAVLAAFAISCGDDDNDASGTSGSGGAAGEGGPAGKGGSSGEAGASGSGGMLPEAGPDAEPDAPPADAAEEGCTADSKVCEGKCVAIDDPAFGCTASSCTPCAYSHGVASCNNGACALGSCVSPWDNCNNDPADGCEVSLSADPVHCGACNIYCTYEHASATCTGICHRGACDTGYADCDKSDGNGCEIDALTDVNHCGACDNVCPGTACKDGKCEAAVPLELASTGYSPFDLAVDADYVYWSSQAGIQRIAKTGGMTTVLSAGGTPNGIALDSTHVYWADTSALEIRSVALAGGVMATLASGQDFPWRVATNGVNVFWTDSMAGAVRSVPVAGGVVASLASSLTGPAGIALNAAYVYFADSDAGTVNRVPLAGGTVAQLVTGESSPMRVAVDSSSVYFTTTVAGGAVKKAPLAGGTAVALASNLPNPVALAIDNSWVYFTEDFAVKKVPVAGGTPVVLADAQASPNAIAVDSTRVYWINYTDETLMAVAK